MYDPYDIARMQKAETQIAPFINIQTTLKDVKQHNGRMSSELEICKEQIKDLT